MPEEGVRSVVTEVAKPPAPEPASEKPDFDIRQAVIYSTILEWKDRYNGL